MNSCKKITIKIICTANNYIFKKNLLLFTLRLPSAVILKRLQDPQKFSVIEDMNPILPINPGT